MSSHRIILSPIGEKMADNGNIERYNDPSLQLTFSKRKVASNVCARGRGCCRKDS